MGLIVQLFLLLYIDLQLYKWTVSMYWQGKFSDTNPSYYAS